MLPMLSIMVDWIAVPRADCIDPEDSGSHVANFPRDVVDLLPPAVPHSQQIDARFPQVGRLFPRITEFDSVDEAMARPKPAHTTRFSGVFQK
jgi:hypothetical protein